MTFIVRRALPSEFETYKRLFEDETISVMFQADEDLNEVNYQSEWLEQMDQETRKRIEEEFKRTLPKYQAVLANPKNERIYMFLDDDKIIGFTQIIKTKTGWSIADLQVQNPKDCLRIRILTDILINIKSVRRLEVNYPLKTTARKRMLEAGFIPTGDHSVLAKFYKELG